MKNKGGHNDRHESHGGGSKKTATSKTKKSCNKGILSCGYSRSSLLRPPAPFTRSLTTEHATSVNSPSSSCCELSGALTISFFSQTVEWQQAWLLSFLYAGLRRRGLTLATSSPPAIFLVTPVQANKQANKWAAHISATPTDSW